MFKMLLKKIKNSWNKKFSKFKKIFILFLAYFIVTYLLIIFGKRIFWPDEGVYIALGKYIFSKGKSGLFEPFRPFLLPVILGLFWKIKLNPLIFGYFFEFVMCLLSVFLTWGVVKKIWGEKYALIASLFIITNLEFIINGTRILADVPALTFAIISIYFFINKKYFFSGLFSGISFMTKFTYGILPIVLVVVYLLEKIFYSNFTKIKNKIFVLKKNLIEILKFVFGLTIITLPYFIYSKIAYGSFTWTLKSASNVVKLYAWFVEYLDFSNYLKKIFINMPLIIFAVFGVFYFLKLMLYKKRLMKNLEFNIVLISIISFLFYILYFGIFARTELRYSLHILFFTAILSVFGISFFEKNLKKKIHKVTLNVFIGTLFFIPTIMQINYVVGLYRGEYYSKSERELINFLKYNIKDDDFILTTTTIPAIYFDNKMLGFASYDYALGVLEQNKFKKGLIIVNNCEYACPVNDLECESKKTEFFRALEKEKLIFETKINDQCSYKVYDNR